MKIYMIAGEASGDLHGGNLVRAIKQKQPDTDIRAWGGDSMRDAGAEVVRHYRDLAFMGFVEVAKNLKTILGNIAFCKKDITEFQPDVLVLLDYPGFNMRIARWAREQIKHQKLTCKIVYYIAPQAWAWHKSRVHDLARDVDKLLVILPFEEAFFQKYGIFTQFCGHPLLDIIPEHVIPLEQREKTIVLLPGSRIQEIHKILPVMLEAVSSFKCFQVVVAGTRHLPTDLYSHYLKAYPTVMLQCDKTYELLKTARLALVKSGTSTLETALFGTPQVVCYKGNSVSYWIAKRVVDIPYISLVNLIADAPVVKELIQGDLHAENLKNEAEYLLHDVNALKQIQAYKELRLKLGGSGASAKVADIILS